MRAGRLQFEGFYFSLLGIQGKFCAALGTQQHYIPEPEIEESILEVESSRIAVRCGLVIERQVEVLGMEVEGEPLLIPTHLAAEDFQALHSKGQHLRHPGRPR